MMRASVAVWTLCGVAVGCVVALLIMPDTRWLVLQQADMVVRPSQTLADLTQSTEDRVSEASSPLLPADTAADVAYCASRRTCDPLATIAVETLVSREPRNAPHPHDVADRLLRKARRLHARPELWAAILSHLHISAFTERLQQDEAHAHTVPAAYGSAQRNLADRSRELERFEDAAVAGERADPSNAFFPMAHAMVLFSARRDEEAIGAILRAAGCSRYDDYAADLRLASLGLLEEARGDHSAFRRIADASCVFSIGINPMPVARLAVACAREEERAGRMERGLAIRRAVVRLGALIADNPRNALLAMSGSTVITSAARGAPIERATLTASAPGRATRSAWTAYIAFLERSGHLDAAREARLARARARKDLMVFAAAGSAGWMEGREAHDLLDLWLCGILLLTAAAAAILTGGAVALGQRLDHALGTPPCRAALRVGTLLVLGWTALRLLMACLMLQTDHGSLFIVEWTAALAGALAIACRVWLPGRCVRARQIAVALLIAAALACAAYALTWSSGAVQIAKVTTRWIEQPEISIATHASLVAAALLAPVTAGILTLLMLALIKRRCKRPAPNLRIRVPLVAGLLTIGSFAMLLTGATDLNGFASRTPTEAIWQSDRPDPSCMGIALIVPLAAFLIVVLGLSVMRAVAGIDGARALTSNGWAVALPLAVVLLVVYSGFAVTTARAEASVRATQDMLLVRGGSYLAELQGTTWSGALH